LVDWDLDCGRFWESKLGIVGILDSDEWESVLAIIVGNSIIGKSRVVTGRMGSTRRIG